MDLQVMLSDAISHTITGLLALNQGFFSYWVSVTNVTDAGADIQVSLVPGSESFFSGAATFMMAATELIKHLGSLLTIVG